MYLDNRKRTVRDHSSFDTCKTGAGSELALHSVINCSFLGMFLRIFLDYGYDVSVLECIWYLDGVGVISVPRCRH